MAKKFKDIKECHKGASKYHSEFEKLKAIEMKKFNLQELADGEDHKTETTSAIFSKSIAGSATKEQGPFSAASSPAK